MENSSSAKLISIKRLKKTREEKEKQLLVFFFFFPYFNEE